MAFLSFTVALVLFSTTNAGPEFYHEVNGTCGDLPSLYVGETRQVPAGLWYLPYATVGEKCGRVYALMRGAPTYLGYGDISVISTKEGKDYNQFTNDIQYLPEEECYEAFSGGKAYILDSDENDYCYYVQCQQDKNSTQVGIMFGSRTPDMSSKAKKAYKNMTDKLKAKNLFPKDKMVKLNLKHCPKLPKTFKAQM